MNPIIRAVLAAVLSAVIVDFTAYMSATKNDPTATFNWKLFGFRLAIAVALGLSSQIGAPSVQ